MFNTTFNKKSFNAGESCLFNYVWINKKPDDEHKEKLCSVSLKHLDRAYKNAKKYPNARVKIWLDHRFLDEKTMAVLHAHKAIYAPPNIEFSDLCSIKKYRKTKLFKPNTKTDIWARVDLARLIVLRHTLKHEDENYVFYSDFDALDLKPKSAIKIMDKFDAAFTTVGALSTLPRITNHDLIAKQRYTEFTIENGYFALKKNTKATNDFLSPLLKQTFSQAQKNLDGYDAFVIQKSAYQDKHNIWNVDNTIPCILPCMGYKIPDKRQYQELNWN